VSDTVVESNVINRILQKLAIETSVGLFAIVFSFLDIPEDYERFLLRRMCRAFRLVLKATVPSGMFTTFPHPKYPTLNGLMDALHRVYQNDPSKAPKIVFVMEGTFHIPVTKSGMFGDMNYVPIRYPLMIRGAGQEKTIIHGGFQIQGTKEEEKRVNMQGMTIKGSSQYGLYNNNGLSFLCKDMTFTQCGLQGVVTDNTKGRLINCVITQCGYSGIGCGGNALIELEGDQTKVDGNVRRGNSSNYGLQTCSKSSIIHLLFPLTQESVSTNNHGGRNYGSHNGGTIKTVDALESL
jgi:hypothetical protein